jgi:hypothetical protein
VGAGWCTEETTKLCGLGVGLAWVSAPKRGEGVPYQAGDEVVAMAEGRVRVWAPVGAPSGQPSRVDSVLVWHGHPRQDEMKGAPRKWGMWWLLWRRGAFPHGRRVMYPTENRAVWARFWAGVRVLTRQS